MKIKKREVVKGQLLFKRKIQNKTCLDQQPKEMPEQSLESLYSITVEVYDEETNNSRYFELSAEQKEAVAQILLKMKCARSFGTGGPIQLRQFPISIDCMADGKSCHVLLGVKGKVYDGSGGLLSECRILNADVLAKELDALLL